jgi:hypothetical protein
MSKPHHRRASHAWLAALGVVFPLRAWAAPAASFDDPVRGHGRSALPLLEAIQNTSPAPEAVAPAIATQSHEDDLYGNPIAWSSEGVKRATHELEQAAQTLYYAYRAASHGARWHQSRPLYAFQKLVRQAQHFHTQVESRWQDPAHTREDLRRVLRALDELDRVFPSAYRSHRVQAEYHRVQQLASAVVSYYRLPRGGHAGGWRHWETVKRLAHHVEDKARHVHQEAERRAHHGDWREQQALRDLHSLEEAARHFHAQVERWRQNPSHTGQDHYSLLEAYRRASYSVRWAHFEAHVRADFAEFRYAIEELARFY